MQPPKNDLRRKAECSRLRGVLANRLEVGALAAVPDVRPRRLLRRLAESPRYQAFPYDRTPDHRGLRSTGRMGTVLYRRGLSRPIRATTRPAELPSAPPGNSASPETRPAFRMRTKTAAGTTICRTATIDQLPMSRAEGLPRRKADAKTGPALRRFKSDHRLVERFHETDHIRSLVIPERHRRWRARNP